MSATAGFDRLLTLPPIGHTSVASWLVSVIDSGRAATQADLDNALEYAKAGLYEASPRLVNFRPSPGGDGRKR